MKALNNHNNEEELPLEVIDIPTDVGIPPTEDIPASDIEKIERQANVFSQIHSITMQDKGFTLLCMCLVALALFYLLDVVLSNVGWKNSDVLDELMDLGKTIVTLLLGYVFATENHKHKN